MTSTFVNKNPLKELLYLNAILICMHVSSPICGYVNYVYACYIEIYACELTKVWVEVYTSAIIKFNSLIHFLNLTLYRHAYALAIINVRSTRRHHTKKHLFPRK